MRPPGWVVCPLVVPRTPWDPPSGALCTLKQNARSSSARGRGHPAEHSTRRSGPIHVCGTDTKENACWQTALGGGSAHPGSPPCSPWTHTATLNCLFTSSGFPLPLTQQRRHLLSFQRGSERRSEKTQVSLEPLKHFEKSLLLALIISHLFMYICM